MAWASDSYGLFVSAATDASMTLKRPNLLIRTVTVDSGGPGDGYRSVGDTVKYSWALVNKANATNIGSGSHAPAAITSNSKNITLDTKYSSSRYVRSFDKTRSSIDNLIEFALAPCIEEVVQQVNAGIGGLMIAAKFNFGANPSIAGGADLFTRAQLTQAYHRLRSNGAPMVYGDLFLATAGVVSGNIGNQAEIYQASYVGDSVAEAFSAEAIPLKFIKTLLVADDDVPVPGAGTYNGLLYHRGAIVLRTAYEAPLRSPHIYETWVDGNGIPVKVTISADALADGHLVTASAVMGLDVVRPELGQILLTS